MTKKLTILSFIFLSAPFLVNAEVSKIVFTSNPQTIKPEQISEVLSIQAQDSSGSSSNTTQTVCLELLTTSSSGEFSSNNTNWEPVSLLTMNKGSANRNFYYKDSSAGTFSLTVKASPRPDTETRPCPSWPVEERSATWVAKQDVVIGSGAVVATQTAVVQAPVSGVEILFSEQKIYAEAGDDKTIIVGAEEKFVGKALGFKKELLEGARYKWSFGDGSTSNSREAVHTYDYVGEYVAVFRVDYYNYSATDRINIKVIKSQLTISEANSEFIKLSNSSGSEINISNWLFRFDGLTFRLPETTVIKSKGELIIPNSISHLKIGSDKELVELLYPDSSVAYVYKGLEPLAVKDPSVVSRATTRAPVSSAVVLVDNKINTPTENSAEISTSQNLASVVYSEEKSSGSAKGWLLPTAGIGLLTALGYVSMKRQKQKIELLPERAGDEFTIEEDKF